MARPNDAPLAFSDTDGPTHPEEMKATYSLRIGNFVTLQATARITPAGIATAGITACLIALAFSYVRSPRRGW